MTLPGLGDLDVPVDFLEWMEPLKSDSSVAFFDLRGLGDLDVASIDFRDSAVPPGVVSSIVFVDRRGRGDLDVDVAPTDFLE